MLNRALSALLLAVGLLAGIGFPLVADDAAKEVAPKPTTLVGEVVTTGEFVEAARAIEAAAKEGSFSLAKHFDFGALCDLTLQGLELAPDFREGYMAGLAREDGTSAITDQIGSSAQLDGGFTLLRVHRHGHNHAALFREKLRGGVNYYDLKLVKGTDGKVKVRDGYIVARGELMSATLRQVVLVSGANKNRSLLTPDENEFVAHYAQFRALLKARKSMDIAKVKEIYESMPKSMRESKSVLLLFHASACQTQQWDDVRKAAADFRRLYPTDVACDVLNSNALILEKKFDEALAAVDRIDKFVGGDPYLDTVRANIKAMEQ